MPQRPRPESGPPRTGKEAEHEVNALESMLPPLDDDAPPAPKKNPTPKPAPDSPATDDPTQSEER